MDVPVELNRILINEKSDHQVIVLKELNGDRTMAIVIGIVEIFAIDRRLKGIEPPRPMTHDLMASIIEELDAHLVKVVIDNLQNHTYFAKLHLMKSDQSTIIVDSRPSDAIALAVASDTPLFVSQHVWDQASQE